MFAVVFFEERERFMLQFFYTNRYNYEEIIIKKLKKNLHIIFQSLIFVAYLYIFIVHFSETEEFIYLYFNYLKEKNYEEIYLSFIVFIISHWTYFCADHTGDRNCYLGG